MNRRSYLKSAGVAAAAGLVAGCSGSGSTESVTYGTLATSVTDQPTDIDDFESCVVTIAGIWITPAGEAESETEDGGDEDDEAAEGTDEAETEMDGTESDGRRYIEFDEAQTADLVDLRGSNTQLLGETEVETGDYERLQMDVTGVEGTLNDGSEAAVDTPGNAPLMFNAEFEIREEERTTFVADFTPVQRGNGSYLIRPVASGTTVLYGEAEYSEEDASGTAEDENTDETATERDTATASGGGEVETGGNDATTATSN